MIRFSMVGIAAICLVQTASGADAVSTAGRAPVMVELFTSQGCSSCPPADRVLSHLAQRPDVVALSFHVTYWDYLGWKDPFGAPANTARQKAYRDTFNNAQIYTPQMVIGGGAEMVGQDEAAVTAAIAAVAAQRRRGPDILLRRDGQLSVTVGQSAASSKATVWLAAYVPHMETAVRRGENAGRALANTNVVRALLALGPYNGEAMTWAAPAQFAGNGDGIAAWVQVDPTGAILSAAQMPPRAE